MTVAAKISGQWVPACSTTELGAEEVRRWEHKGHSYAIFCSPEGEFFATDDICTHEHAHLSDGYVEDDCVECPRHAGRFSYKTGEALGAPVCIDLKIHPIRVANGQIETMVTRQSRLRALRVPAQCYLRRRLPSKRSGERKHVDLMTFDCSGRPSSCTYGAQFN